MNKKNSFNDSNILADRLFLNTPNPMCITKAADGTFVEVNEAFLNFSGLKSEDVIGKTSLETGQMTAKERTKIINDIKKKGYAENIEKEIKIKGKNNDAKYVSFNTFPIKGGRNGLFLTIITDISRLRLGREPQENILFKSLGAIKGTGVILINGNKQSKPHIFVNDAAKKALKGKSVNDLLNALTGRKSIYFNTASGCYQVKIVSRNHNSLKIIQMEQAPINVSVKEILKNKNLSPQERETAYLIAMGYSNRQIAEELSISEYTVKEYVKDIFQKFNLNKRSELCSRILGWR